MLRAVCRISPPPSPAFLILWVPGGFRATCYYYRKAYYRSFFQSPPACAVRDAGKVRVLYPASGAHLAPLELVHRGHRELPTVEVRRVA